MATMASVKKKARISYKVLTLGIYYRMVIRQGPMSCLQPRGTAVATYVPVEAEIRELSASLLVFGPGFLLV